MIARLRIGLVAWLAVRDLRHAWQSTACLVVAVAAALTPLLLLFALKFGVITSLIDTMRTDPRIREISLVRDTELSPEWFAALQARDDVGFLLPRANYLASSVRLRGADGRSLLETRLIPTDQGDPLLAGHEVPRGLSEIVMTARAAQEAKAVPGDTVTLIVRRFVNDEQQRERHRVLVRDVIPRDLLQTDDIFVTRSLEDAIERYRQGFAVEKLGWEGVRASSSTAAPSFASFRLYATDVRTVPGLRDHLLREGLDVRTRAEEIETTLAIETGLGWVFLVVSTLAAAGFLVTLGLHLAAAAVEKARELAVLRLLGLRSLELALIPSLQGIFIGGLGALFAFGAFVVAQPLLNSALEGLAGLSGDVALMQSRHFVIALLATLAAGALSGSVAGLQTASLEPTEGLRRD
ncbi:ABC transporter permease [Pseudaestuariivita atlantica]|uniref:ABC3 transporter permease protein domain-containing protein n=1 Tax=Pseudaestuariivita atlantica TaxID=1317121 RepID=A0A0L1JS70_9RHOB|nr:ABC transporter permease [Pseudaestuariivita atlantica]KNG94639.1 hypothetical protein ATO11_04345 [Pseudaestuariivita atlantica]